MKRIIFSFIFGCLVVASCQKKEVADLDVFIFGIYNGFCIEGCSDIFKIEGGKLYKDNVNRIAGIEDLSFEDEPLDYSEYEFAMILKETLPDELLQIEDEEDRFIGCPGCVDQNIIMIAYEKDGEMVEFQIDTIEDQLPEYLRPYVSKVEEVVNFLKE